MTGRSSIALRRGDVVLVPFPYAELTATKARPALIVSSDAFTAAEARITVAGITSNVRGSTKNRGADLRDESRSFSLAGR